MLLDQNRVGDGKPPDQGLCHHRCPGERSREAEGELWVLRDVL